MLLDYCNLVDRCIGEDMPLMFELLGMELPAKFYSKNEAEEKIGEENRRIELKEITVEKNDAYEVLDE